MMRLAFLLPLGLIGVPAFLALFAVASEDDPFPHAAHKGLFPTCTACHAGIAADNSSAFYTVTDQDCQSCHDGKRLERVEWERPSPRVSPAIFDHGPHLVDAEVTCATCHQEPDARDRMDVVVQGSRFCLDCHQYGDHFASETDCAVCHQPLAQNPALSVADISAFRQPQNHDHPDFIHTHGDLAESLAPACATCHARETCERCHPNAVSLSQIQTLAADSRVQQVVAEMEGAWPRPQNHDDPEWIFAHGNNIEDTINRCANCHVQPNCRECHGEGNHVQGLGVLSMGIPGQASGVTLAGAKPPEHTAEFTLDHASAAASGSMDCMTCHTPTTCETCHRGVESSGFHPVNYFMNHGSDAYARDTNCASCHSPEVFCRTCHETSGLSSSDVKSSSYHDAQPFWLLGHGQAARQSLETCASCHQQNDCLTCHSSKTGWGVNPHGPDFQGQRLGDRNLQMCSRCHFSDPR